MGKKNFTEERIARLPSGDVGGPVQWSSEMAYREKAIHAPSPANDGERQSTWATPINAKVSRGESLNSKR
jgi:hypothetical protein